MQQMYEASRISGVLVEVFLDLGGLIGVILPTWFIWDCYPPISWDIHGYLSTLPANEYQPVQSDGIEVFGGFLK